MKPEHLTALTMVAVTVIVLAHLLDPNRVAYEESMTVREKLEALQSSVANVTALVQAQIAEIASLKAQLSTSDSDVQALQAQIDALNALTVPAAPAAQ